MSRTYLAGLAILCAAGGAALGQNSDNAAATKATTTCQNCHGPKGDSTVATFPRLNAQQADYISTQLKNFREHKRSDPHAVAYMWGMASQLEDALIGELAKYYASQLQLFRRPAARSQPRARKSMKAARPPTAYRPVRLVMARM